MRTGPDEGGESSAAVLDLVVKSLSGGALLLPVIGAVTLALHLASLAPGVDVLSIVGDESVAALALRGGYHLVLFAGFVGPPLIIAAPRGFEAALASHERARERFESLENDLKRTLSAAYRSVLLGDESAAAGARERLFRLQEEWHSFLDNELTQAEEDANRAQEAVGEPPSRLTRLFRASGRLASPWLAVSMLALAVLALVLITPWTSAAVGLGSSLLIIFVYTRSSSRRLYRSRLARYVPAVAILFVGSITLGLLNGPTGFSAGRYSFGMSSLDGEYVRIGDADGLLYLLPCEDATEESQTRQPIAVDQQAAETVIFTALRRIRPSTGWELLTGDEAKLSPGTITCTSAEEE